MTVNYAEIANTDEQTLHAEEPVVAYVASKTPFVGTWHIREEFYKHYNRWLMETMFLSSPRSILCHRDFKAIAMMGEEAVPYILAEIRKEPSFLYKALEKICNEVLLPARVERKGNVAAIYDDVEMNCRLWIEKLN